MRCRTLGQRILVPARTVQPADAAARAQTAEHALSDLAAASRLGPDAVDALKLRGLTDLVRVLHPRRACADLVGACELGECQNLRAAQERKICP
jgi:hypothetical protein